MEKHDSDRESEENISIYDNDENIINFSENRHWESREESKLGAFEKYSSGIPKNGFKASDMDAKGRTYRRAKKIFNDIYNELCNICVPDDPDICHSFLVKDTDAKMNYELGLLQSNIINIFSHGANDISTICGSIIAKYHSSDRSKEIIEASFENVSLTQSRTIPGSRISLGCKQVESLRTKFDLLVEKKDVRNI